VRGLRAVARTPKSIHVARGELVLPRELLTPEVMEFIAAQAQERGIDPRRLMVGGQSSINPATGAEEFGIFDKLRGWLGGSKANATGLEILGIDKPPASTQRHEHPIENRTLPFMPESEGGRRAYEVVPLASKPESPEAAQIDEIPVTARRVQREPLPMFLVVEMAMQSISKQDLRNLKRPKKLETSQRCGEYPRSCDKKYCRQGCLMKLVNYRAEIHRAMTREYSRSQPRNQCWILPEFKVLKPIRCFAVSQINSAEFRNHMTRMARSVTIIC
jgi:hypothetical protein